ncbi:MAG TPA: thermonuclease family protein [Rhodopseudomonas sp.]|uniref:thermonuclease family protein n=1 Tax=Rhodopseudomonas sp. TaxID=1078 RepID=UPI002ED7EE1B
MFFGADFALAEGCRLPPQGEGRVAAVIDARSLRLQDGRDVRLSGIEVFPERRQHAVAALTALIAQRDITLHGDSDSPDRYGRQPALVFREGEAVSLQAQLLAAGEAVSAGDIADPDCRTELSLAEAQARRARRGLWAEPAAIKNAENPGDILSGVGRFALVEGRVLSVRDAGAMIYLNFGQRWTRDFAVTISRRMAAALETLGTPPKSFEGRRILVRGWVEKRRGPRIEMIGAGQIQLRDDG